MDVLAMIMDKNHTWMVFGWPEMMMNDDKK